MNDKSKYITNLKNDLLKHSVATIVKGEEIFFKKGNSEINFFIAGEGFSFEKHESERLIPLDYIATQRNKVVAMICSKLKLNDTIFARNCEVRRTDKETATEFLDKYHLMNSTQSAFNFGLYYKDELVALASFSKGRKMHRLKPEQRSYELIRFCSKEGITVTGGLTKLIKNFCEEKKAGDIMTYVDKQLSDGQSFTSAGFKKSGEAPPVYFIVNKRTFVRLSFHGNPADFNKPGFYLTQNTGSIKLIYTPNE